MPEPGDSSRRLARERSHAPSWLTLDVVEEGGDWPAFGPASQLVATAGEALARHARFKNSEPARACVSLSNAAAVRRLNARFRGIDKATNVLSFPSAAIQAGPPGAQRSLGDIALAQEIVAREAGEQGIPAHHHLQHLVIHGLLHLMGFDHERDSDAEVMEGLEIEILSSLGISNPYSVPLNSIDLAASTSGQNA